MIKYEALCKTGYIRANNEDNFYINGNYLPMVHDDAEKHSGHNTHGVFAVFDGMGGEEHGEAASFLGARTLANNSALSMTDICLTMNKVVCDYSRENKLRFCGSTVAMVSIAGGDAVCSNLGDSRIYLLRDGKLIQISEDHTVTVLGRKRITQCLGIPETEFILCPHIDTIPTQKNDLFFICSDGVTDMVSDEELENILQQAEPLNELNVLIQDRGAKDNYTGILLEVE